MPGVPRHVVDYLPACWPPTTAGSTLPKGSPRRALPPGLAGQRKEPAILPQTRRGSWRAEYPHLAGQHDDRNRAGSAQIGGYRV